MAREAEQLRARLAEDRGDLAEIGGAEERRAAFAELAAVEAVLSERCRVAVAAARVSPPDYVLKELGERPSDPAKREAWDSAVRGIEGYRQRHGIVDRDSALGRGRRSERRG
jgi:hypothetical protein